MGNAATESKRRWNEAHYTQVKVSVDPDTASAFKSACEVAGVSMASVLSEYMSKYSKISCKSKPPVDMLATRPRRRKMAGSIIQQLEELVAAEECYRDNIPDNLQCSVRYENADQCVTVLYEVIELLENAY